MDLYAGLKRLADTQSLEPQPRDQKANSSDIAGDPKSSSSDLLSTNEWQRLKKEVDASYQGNAVREVLWAITLFFVLIEVTPVLVEVLAPPGPYDVFLRGENQAAERQYFRFSETSYQVDQTYREEYEKSYKLAIKKIYESIQRDFENVREGKLAEVLQSHWDALRARLRETLRRLEDEYLRTASMKRENGWTPPRLPQLKIWVVIPPIVVFFTFLICLSILISNNVNQVMALQISISSAILETGVISLVFNLLGPRKAH